MAGGDLADGQDARIRMDAVLDPAAKDHLTALLAGVATVVGRIDHVAVTRARNLL